MRARYTAVLAGLATTAAIAVPAVAQARSGSDDPPNHEQRSGQMEHARRHDRVDNDRREHRAGHDRDRDHHGRGDDRADND